MTKHLTLTINPVAKEELYEIIREFEGCKLRAYPDPLTGGEPYTCGWGETEGVTRNTVWTQEEADRRRDESLAKREIVVRKHFKNIPNDFMLAALISIVYNVGEGRTRRTNGLKDPGRDGIIRLKSGLPSTLLRKFNAGDYRGAGNQFPLWISPGTNVTEGLLRRRKVELALYNRTK